MGWTNTTWEYMRNMYKISVRKSEKKENIRLRYKWEAIWQVGGDSSSGPDKDQSRVNVNMMMNL
jgi:hypothetical protein